jgi:hypothetical protein
MPARLDLLGRDGAPLCFACEVNAAHLDHVADRHRITQGKARATATNSLGQGTRLTLHVQDVRGHQAGYHFASARDYELLAARGALDEFGQATPRFEDADGGHGDRAPAFGHRNRLVEKPQ